MGSTISNKSACMGVCLMQYSPVSRGGDKVQAAVHPVVRHLSSVDTRLCVKVILKLTVDVIDHRLPAAALKKEREGVKRNKLILVVVTDGKAGAS